jgi:hypothetical protein
MDNQLADFLAERRDAQRERTAEYLFERFLSKNASRKESNHDHQTQGQRFICGRRYS